jgi:hypothetical protein
MDEAAHALRLYEREGVSVAKARPVITKMMMRGFVLVDIGGGDIVWQRDMYSSPPRRGQWPDLKLQILGPDGEILTDFKKRGNVSVEDRNGAGFYGVVDKIGVFIDTFATFNYD